MAAVVTRFAPSPTGFLHIGGARTALFNWLYARHKGGKFLLRIEDTDRARSTPEAIEAILDGLGWLGLHADEDPVYQFSRRNRHAEVAQQLLKDGKAYHCYASQEELAEMRETARAEGRQPGYDGRWRDRDPSGAPDGVTPVVRFRSPDEGETIVDDAVQGKVRFANKQLDDMVLLRADGTPTYMLSVVVDDHDMGVTHAIRGDDHLTNAARQTQLFEAIGWRPPVYAHIPLIHGPDGKKLSKRHGALGVEAYRDMGYLPEALLNYLMRLGWGHGDHEILPIEEAIRLFDLDGIGKGAARFDFAKLGAFNGHYIREATDRHLVDATRPFIEERIGRTAKEDELTRLEEVMHALKLRARTLLELADGAEFLFKIRPLEMSEKAARILDDDARTVLGALKPALERAEDWSVDALEATVKAFAEERELKLGKVAQPLRAALTGSTVSPGIFDVLAVLGREESLGRIAEQANA